MEYHQVFRFLWSCVRRLIPGQMWGSKSNRNIAMMMIERFVTLRRYEDFNVDYYAAKWKMTHCSWLAKPKVPSQYVANQTMVGQWLRWIMNDVVIALLRNHFYITESAMHRNKVFYFRKPLWKQIVETELGRVKHLSTLQNGMFRRLSDVEFEELFSNRFGLPISQLRLLPKSSGMRLIGNLSSRGKLTDSANFILRPAFEVLRFELMYNGKSHLLGSSVFNLGDVHSKILPFIQWYRKHSRKKLYFVSVDVKRSFDSIKQGKLCDILFAKNEEQVMTSEQYVSQKYSVHLPCVGHLVSSHKTAILPALNLQPLHMTLKERMSNASNPRNSVVIDSAGCEFFERKQIEAVLKHHITKNVIRVGNAYFIQQVGIPQGSVLSSLLCSLFYGHMERHGLSDLPINFKEEEEEKEEEGEGDKGILLRFIDDNLFIVSSESPAQEFVQRLHNNFVEEYGTQLNPNKTLVNFLCKVSGKTLPRVDRFLPWCGVLIDVETLQFYGDYTRYVGNYMNESLTAAYANHPGNSLRQKIKQFAQPKCIPLLLDSRINELSTIQLNCYQIFLLCAIKYHCHVKCLPFHSKNEKYLFDVIVDVIEYTNALIQSRLYKSEDLTHCHVRFLGRHAFRSVLWRKQTMYPNVLMQLNTQMNHDPYFNGLEKKFASVTDKERSKIFHNEIIF